MCWTIFAWKSAQLLYVLIYFWPRLIIFYRSILSWSIGGGGATGRSAVPPADFYRCIDVLIEILHPLLVWEQLALERYWISPLSHVSATLLLGESHWAARSREVLPSPLLHVSLSLTLTVIETFIYFNRPQKVWIGLGQEHCVWLKWHARMRGSKPRSRLLALQNAIAGRNAFHYTGHGSHLD